MHYLGTDLGIKAARSYSVTPSGLSIAVIPASPDFTRVLPFSENSSTSDRLDIHL